MQLWKSWLGHFVTIQVLLSHFQVGVDRQDQSPSDGLIRLKSPPADGCQARFSGEGKEIL